MNTPPIDASIPILSSRLLEALPAESVIGNYSRQVSDALISFVDPAPVSTPKVLLVSDALRDELGFSRNFCASESFAALMSGNLAFAGVRPFATRYGGHQFGQWAGQLGDGRAINLGEVRTPQGHYLNLQLKGAGPTPYSRGADGRAVLRSSVREFLCSEAMFHLGVPTTRALSLVVTGDTVLRDMFYDGNPQWEPGAIVCRVAPSFTRFGHFQLCAYRGEISLLDALVRQTIVDDFAYLPLADEIKGKGLTSSLLVEWFSHVCDLTLSMIVDWMRVGFVHGVMNTDNMSILGLTIDYGPYGWLDHYDPEWTPNTTDAEMRRYRFSQQPDIALWNLYQLANALLPLLEDKKDIETVLLRFPANYENAWLEMMRKKLGLSVAANGDSQLIEDLLTVLTLREIDMTIFYRELARFDVQMEHGSLSMCIEDALYDKSPLTAHEDALLKRWELAYRNRLASEKVPQTVRTQQMNAVNPWFILRNFLVTEAIDLAHDGDFSGIESLYYALQNPYEEAAKNLSFYRKRPEWARHRAGASMLSCSS